MIATMIAMMIAMMIVIRNVAFFIVLEAILVVMVDTRISRRNGNIPRGRHDDEEEDDDEKSLLLFFRILIVQ